MPLGPLSPSPLSPSILTLCHNGLSAFNLDCSGDLLGGGDQHPQADAWVNASSYSNLPDMRECSSPYLGSCASPEGGEYLPEGRVSA